jgi:hypothetical protein
MTIGSPFALPLLSWRLYARSTILKLDDAWKDRVHVGLAVALDSRILVVCFGVMSGANTGCMLCVIGRIVSVDARTVPNAGTFFWRQARTSSRTFAICPVARANNRLAL